MISISAIAFIGGIALRLGIRIDRALVVIQETIHRVVRGWFRSEVGDPGLTKISLLRSRKTVYHGRRGFESMPVCCEMGIGIQYSDPWCLFLPHRPSVAQILCKEHGATGWTGVTHQKWAALALFK